MPCSVKLIKRSEQDVTFILIQFSFCCAEAFITPWARIQNMMENTVQENIEDIKADKLDDHMVGEIGSGQYLIRAEESKIRQLIIQRQRQLLSKFELAIVRCCSSTSDINLDRCFDLNGFRAIGFSMRPCQFLGVVLEKLNQTRK